MKNDKNENQGKNVECTDFKCHVQQCEENDDEPYISHVVVMKSGEVFYANQSIELDSQLPSGEIEVLMAIDVLDFPEENDRSIITCRRADVDYTQEFYDESIWNELVRVSFCSKCEAVAKYETHTGMFV